MAPGTRVWSVAFLRKVRADIPSVRDDIGTMVMPLVTSLFAVTGDGSCVHYEAGRANAAGS